MDQQRGLVSSVERETIPGSIEKRAANLLIGAIPEDEALEAPAEEAPKKTTRKRKKEE